MKKNNIIKYLGVSLFVFFGCLFSSCFGSNLTIQVDSCQSANNIENCLVDVFGNFTGNMYDNILYYSPYNSVIKGWFWYSGHLATYFGGTSYMDGRNGPRNKAVVLKTYCSTGYLGTCEDFSISTDSFYSLTNITLDSITWVDYDGQVSSNNNAGHLCLNFVNPADTTFCFDSPEVFEGGDGGGCNGFESVADRFECIPEISANRTEPVMSADIIVQNSSLSPFVGGGGGDIPDIIGSGSTVLTNSAVALGLSYRYGYGVEDCYGGYPLNDIFTADLDPANFTGFLYGSGASIYDIFNAYSGSYFTDINTFYNSFYSRYSIGNISSFWDYPKGLYGISQRAGFLSTIYDLYPVNMANLVEFCDLKLKSDPDALYTGDNYIGIEGYYSLIGEVYDKRRYYDTNLFSGSDSTGSMSIDDFFISVSNRLVAGLEDISDNRTGIIPSYILMVMMALILFRLISH